MTIYRWTEISNIPSDKGIYAWYYSPEIPDYDLDNIIKKINSLKNNNDLKSAEYIITNFLDKHIFNYFQQQPFKVIVNGSFRTKYEGNIEHKINISEALVSRIRDEPQRLKTIKQIIKSSAPNFASPIYIGMSKKLDQRLRQHKILIEKYLTDSISPEEMREENIDHSFALEISLRKIIPDQLFVVIKTIDCEDTTYIDIENILNRIHYPLLGRN